MIQDNVFTCTQNTTKSQLTLAHCIRNGKIGKNEKITFFSERNADDNRPSPWRQPRRKKWIYGWKNWWYR